MACPWRGRKWQNKSSSAKLPKCCSPCGPQITHGDPCELRNCTSCRTIAQKFLREPRAGPNSTRIDRVGSNFGRCWLDLANMWQVSAKLGRCRPTSGRVWPKLGQVRSTFGRIWPKSFQIWLMSINKLAKIPKCRSNIAACWPSSVNSG